MPLPIEDYALIGDNQSAALVGIDGSIDWFCAPSFDSGACFAALLGGPEHGRWLLAPASAAATPTRAARRTYRAARRGYRDGTLILETQFDTPDGSVRLIDFMTPTGGDTDIVRIVEGLSGRVAMRLELVVRFDYGSIVPWVRRTEDGALVAVGGPDALVFRTPVEVRGEGLTTVGDFTVLAGERVASTLTWFPSTREPPGPLDAEARLGETTAVGMKWAARCSYKGPYREAVVRSLVTLRALAYEPTGGIVAAPTTSLPEVIGGVRNWDYRICWLRDASFTLLALMRCGYLEEARGWRDWLLRSIAGDPADLQVMYGLRGERRLTELTLTWLPGYEASAPVRIGNAASRQFQLDVYGEVIAALRIARVAGLPPDDAAWRVELAILDFVEKAWRRPDEGIWEVRGPRRHFTHSKVMAWVAIDRAVKEGEQFGLEGPLERWRALREEIHAEVCREGFSAARGSFVQSYGSTALDASLLLIPLVGFLPPGDERVRGTVEAIERELVVDGFVLRYARETAGAVDGLPGIEGVFLPCTFWLADCLHMLGRREEAKALFERLLAIRNDVGLLSEEYDPTAKRLLGNFPQAFTHVALVNTAMRLAGGDGLVAGRNVGDKGATETRS